MNVKEYYKHWFNPSHGLELLLGHEGVRTNENGILFHAQYVSLDKIAYKHKEESVKLIHGLRSLTHRYYRDELGSKPKKWMIPVSGQYAKVLGLYDRGANESLTGSPNQYYDKGEPAVREISRDNLMAIVYLSLLFDMREHTYIADMYIRSMARMPNHNISAVLNPFQGNAWANFQFQFLWDGSWFLRMSDKKWHNIIGWLLYPFYWLSLFAIARKEVERDGKHEPKNSGDCLLYIRQLCEYIKYGKRSKTADWVMTRKWGDNWGRKALLSYHKWRKHDFPVTMILEGK